jgi:hypothetical protein
LISLGLRWAVSVTDRKLFLASAHIEYSSA